MRRELTLLAMVVLSIIAVSCIDPNVHLPDETPVKPTTLELTSSPGASVYLDGTLEGTVPAGGTLYLANLTPGKRALKVEQNGYYPHTETISLAEFRANTLDVKLLNLSDGVDSVSVYLNGLALSDMNAAPTVHLSGPNGTFTCMPSDFTSPRVETSTRWTIKDKAVTVPSGLSMWCVVGPVQNGAYTLSADVAGYTSVSEDVKVGAGQSTFSVPLKQDPVVPASDLSPGQCAVSPGFTGFDCDSATLYVLGNQTKSYELPDGSTHEVTSFIDYLSFHVTNKDSTDMLFGAPSIDMNGGGSMGGGDYGAGFTSPGASASFGMPVTLADGSSFTDSFSTTGSLMYVSNRNLLAVLEPVSFLPRVNRTYEGASLDPGACKLSMITTNVTFDASDMISCIEAFDGANLEQQVHDQCTLRPAFFGQWTLHMGALDMPFLVSCDQVLTSPSSNDQCTSSPSLFSCDDFSLKTLTSLGVEHLVLNVSNGLGADVQLRSASVYNNTWLMPGQTPLCDQVNVNRMIPNGARDTVTVDFKDCERSITENTYAYTPQKVYLVRFDALVGGQPKNLTVRVYSGSWNQ